MPDQLDASALKQLSGKLEALRPKGATLFKDRGFAGRERLYTEGSYDVNSMNAYYGSTDLLVESINDAVSSVKLDPGYKVTLYDHGDFSGASKTFTASAEYVGDDFENKTSSIVVEKL
jgi:hypothetical protein